MFPRSQASVGAPQRLVVWLLAAVLTVVAGSAAAQEAPPEKPQAEPKKQPPPARIDIPFPEKEWATFEWEKRGKRVGQTSFLWAKEKPKDGGPEQIRVRGKFDFTADGRRIVADGVAFLTPALKPISYRVSRSTFVARTGIGETVTSADFRGPTVVVNVKLKDDNVVTREIPKSDATYLYDGQAFEHWVLIAAILQQTKPATIEVALPTEIMSLTFDVACEKDGLLWKWTLTSQSFTAEIWTTNLGRLERYRQKRLEIRRVDKKSETPKPKK